MAEENLWGTLKQQQQQMDDAVQRMTNGVSDFRPPIEPWQPAVDVAVDNDRLVISMDLPGVSQEQIRIQLNAGQLVIEGERPEDSGLRLQRQECPRGAFSRSLVLPAGVCSEHLSARCHQGVLRIEITGLTADDQVRVEDI